MESEEEGEEEGEGEGEKVHLQQPQLLDLNNPIRIKWFN